MYTQRAGLPGCRSLDARRVVYSLVLHYQYVRYSGTAPNLNHQGLVVWKQIPYAYWLWNVRDRMAACN